MELEHMSRGELVAELKRLHRMGRRDLEMAGRVQDRLIAGSRTSERIAVAVRYIPFGGLSGDCVGIHEDDPANWDVSVFDVSGHGVAAAIMASAVSLDYRRLLAGLLEPAEVLARLDRLLEEQFGDLGMFMTVSICHFYLDDMLVRHGGAGHPPAMLVRADGGPVQPLDSQNPALGLGLVATGRFLQAEIPVAAGDLLVQYTDGVTEAADRGGEMFGTERLRRLLAACRGLAAADAADRILRKVERFASGHLRDDVALAVAEVRG
jgi:sigma-B regulation protein RsbU (phosphoserine phosphatase)